MTYKDFTNYEVFPEEQRIYSIKKKADLKSFIEYGYVNYFLYKNGKKYTLKAHRVFWECVNGEIPEGYEIDHINTIKEDNRLENLRCVTHSENCNNKISVEKYKKSNKTNGKHKGLVNREDLSKPINVYDYYSGKYLATYKSIQEASMELNVSQPNINRNLRGVGKQEKGYTFCYV